MDSIEQDDTQEIFQECSNDFLAREESNLERKNQENYQDFDYFKQTKNSQHVVHVGIVVVLLTICLGLTNVPKCLVNCVENTPRNEKVQENKQDILNYLQQTNKIGSTHILERLLEYKDICKDLEIFTKDIKGNQQETQQKEEENAKYCEEIGNNNHDLIDMEVSSSGAIEENDNLDLLDNSGSGSVGQDSDCANINRPKNKKSKYSIKTTNNKNGFNKYNKSTKTKFQKHQKKDLNLNKKNSTAEPIIYLFALVFIYLLLKAASDINQHYKSQNKNDKRLRRCSLQSYAQTHRPDRRASKASTSELALKQKQQQLKHRLQSLTRCSDQDQPNYHYNYHHQQQPQALHQHLMDTSSQQSSEIRQQTSAGASPVRTNISCSNKWQLLRQHTTTHSLDNSDILHTSGGNTEMFTPRMARRCSVPAALNFQRQNISTASPLSIVNDPTVSLSRRTSIVASSLPLGVDLNESLIPETKRRVRMINRH